MPLAPQHPFSQLALLAAYLACACTTGCGRSGSLVEIPPPGSPTAAQPPGPPPAHAAELATVGSEAAKSTVADLEARLDRVPALATELQPQLSKIALGETAPGTLTVQGGGRRAEVARGEVPRHERWEVRFPPGNSIESYTRQLDHFKIELGAIGVEDHITYLTNLSNPRPERRPGFASDEQRLYLVWQRGEMAEADQQLAARAGVRTTGKVLAHFLPAEVEAELGRLEEAFARQLNIQRIRKTVFGVRAAGQDGFRFYVIEQKADLR